MSFANNFLTYRSAVQKLVKQNLHLNDPLSARIGEMIQLHIYTFISGRLNAAPHNAPFN